MPDSGFLPEKQRREYEYDGREKKKERVDDSANLVAL